MRFAMTSPSPDTRNSGRDTTLSGSSGCLAFESDAAGLSGVDAINDRAHLHRLFDGAVMVCELTDFDDDEAYGFDD